MQRRTTRALNFTKAAIEKLQPPAGGREYHYDERGGGLAVCVTPAGTKTFYVVRRIPRTEQRPSCVEFVKIGPWPEYTVDMARDEAAKINGRVAEGVNPNDKRRASRQAPTFAAVFAEFIDAPTRTKAKRPKSAKTKHGYRQQWEAYLKPWHERQLSSVTHADVERLQNELAKDVGPHTANRVLALVKAIYNHAIDLEWFGANPAARVPAFEEHSRDRFIQADEFPKFWTALEADSPEVSDKARDFIKLALFTGQRRSNVLSMRWADVNLDRAIWTIPQTKTGQHVVPLTAQAIDVLKRRQGNGSEYVFPAHHNGGALKDPMRAWRDVLKRAGIGDLRIHDLRRTMGSWQTMQGASRPIVGKLLGHAREETTAIYGRLDLTPVRESAEAATAAMLAAAKPQSKRKAKGGDSGKG
jgi:integrase